MKDIDLWNRIEEFELDDKGIDFPFSARLARDNNWSLEYSFRVIYEYKKFIYLCCAGYGEVTPSDAVDQAWHQHLTFTKSYWIEFCNKTLGKHIHHNPTKGGEKEKNRFSNSYDLLLNAYKTEFDSFPPNDIWPKNEERFSNINFKRVNYSDYWIIRKSPVRRSLYLTLTLPLITLLFIQADSSIPWFPLIVFAICILFLIRGFIPQNKKGRNRRRNRDSNSGSDPGSIWTDFWGCSDDDSGCGSHGCSSGCSSGCGGGD